MRTVKYSARVTVSDYDPLTVQFGAAKAHNSEGNMATSDHAGVSNARASRLGSWVLSVLGGALLLPCAAAGQTNVLTQRYDNGRNGHALDPSITPSSFSSGLWQKRADLSVDGAVYAQPLYEAGRVMTADGLSHNALYVATARNRVYAFDADSHALLWSNTTLPSADRSDDSISESCGVLSPTYVPNGWKPPQSTSALEYGIGILSTPVIDRSAGYMYFTYRTNTALIHTPAFGRQHLARIKLANGQIDKDVDITANLPAPFSGLRQRVSLLLLNGVIYVAFGSRCEDLSKSDPGTYGFRGTVAAFSQSALAYLDRFDAVDASTGRNGGGIWQASSGLAADADSIYFTTGNLDIPDVPTLPAAVPRGPNMVPSSFVRLKPGTVNGQYSIRSHVSFFTPYRAHWQDAIDLDLGSAGVLLPAGTNQLVSGGKEGVLYVLDRNSASNAGLGNVYNPWTNLPACVTNDPQDALALCEDGKASPCYFPDQPESGVRQKFYATANMDCRMPSMKNWAFWAHIHGTPVFGRIGNDPNKKDYLYVWPERGQLKAFARVGLTGDLTFNPLAITAPAVSPNLGMPGGMLTLSSPSSTGGAGVLFGASPMEETGYSVLRGQLVAFDAEPHNGSLTPLWGDYDEEYYHAKFVPPTVARGKVFLATFSNKVKVYGIGSTPPAASEATEIGTVLTDAATKSLSAAIVNPSGDVAVYGTSNNGPWGLQTVLSVAAKFPKGAPVALDLQGTQLDGFVVDNNQQLNVFWKNTFTGVWSIAPLSSSTSIPTSSPIATRRVSSSELQVFVVDADGDLHMFWVTWNGWFWSSWQDGKVLGTSGSKFPQRAALTTDFQYSSSTGTSRTVVFVADNASHVMMYTPSTTPGAPKTSFTSSQIPGIVLQPGAPLATGHAQASGTSNVLYVFAIAGNTTSGVDPDDAPNIFSSYNTSIASGSLVAMRATNFGSWSVKSITRELTPPGVPGTGRIAALNQGANQLDIVFVSQMGRTMLYWVDASSPDAWWRTPLNWLDARPGAPIAITPQSLSAGAPNQIDVMVPLTSGVYSSVLPNSTGTWTAPIRLF